MIQFAVWHEGIPERQARWVLHVDTQGDRLLLAQDDGSLYWRPLEECKAMRFATPDQPIPVVPVQINQAPQIVAAPGPMPRADRRAMQFG